MTRRAGKNMWNLSVQPNSTQANKKGNQRWQLEQNQGIRSAREFGAQVSLSQNNQQLYQF